VGWGRAQQQQQKSAAAAVAAAAARQGQNEINTAMTMNSFLNCEVLCSESLTKSTKSIFISHRTDHGSSLVFEILPAFKCISWACAFRAEDDVSVLFKGRSKA
jgi:hypothetical protein